MRPTHSVLNRPSARTHGCVSDTYDIGPDPFVEGLSHGKGSP